MSSPCVESSDTVALGISGDVLRADSIIAPDSNLLASSASGLLSELAVGGGLSLVTLAAGHLEVDLDTVSAEDDGFLAGVNVGAIAGTPSGLTGGELFVTFTNPSTERSALLFAHLQFATELARIGSGAIWHLYAEYKIDAGGWQQAGYRAWDQRFAYSGGVTAMERAGGPMSSLIVQGMTPGQVITVGMHRTLTVTAAETTPGSSFLDGSGDLSMAGLMVIV